MASGSRIAQVGQLLPPCNVSFRQECEAGLFESEPAADGWSGADVIDKEGVHGIANAIAQIVADGAHTV